MPYCRAGDTSPTPRVSATESPTNMTLSGWPGANGGRLVRSPEGVVPLVTAVDLAGVAATTSAAVAAGTVVAATVAATVAPMAAGRAVAARQRRSAPRRIGCSTA